MLPLPVFSSSSISMTAISRRQNGRCSSRSRRAAPVRLRSSCLQPFQFQTDGTHVVFTFCSSRVLTHCRFPLCTIEQIIGGGWSSTAILFVLAREPDFADSLLPVSLKRLSFLASFCQNAVDYPKAIYWRQQCSLNSFLRLGCGGPPHRKLE